MLASEEQEGPRRIDVAVELERQQPRPPTRPQLPLRPGDAALGGADLTAALPASHKLLHSKRKSSSLAHTARTAASGVKRQRARRTTSSLCCPGGLRPRTTRLPMQNASLHPIRPALQSARTRSRPTIAFIARPWTDRTSALATSRSRRLSRRGTSRVIASASAGAPAAQLLRHAGDRPARAGPTTHSCPVGTRPRTSLRDASIVPSQPNPRICER